ncbi:MAG: integral rane sensor signal transduction histidine kinase [Ornithinibacter sp.]|nr:integral rane sensor signal transduction histidine kinase [Ornithinibacter sp.]
MNPERPLDGIRTIRTKLGLLVGVSVVVAAVVAEVGDAAGVAGWISLPVTVAAALAVTQWLARGMTSPLREMTTAAGAMARGDHGQRVAASSTDEVGELARAFNAMAADLASADQQRRLLVATVSHELRTPLSAQRALLENLVDGVVRPDDEVLRAALRQSERLSALVGDLLDLSRIDAGAAPLELTDVVVSELLHDVVAEAGVDGRTVRVRTAVEPPELTVRADPARLHQLVANLVDNAVRHSPQGREVHVVAASVDAATWSLEVCDDGPGIPVDRVDRVFDRFGSGEDAGGGTGLGLAIARWVGELHGGTVTVVPTAPGGTGARVRAVLPRAPKAQRRPGPDEESHTMNAPATTNPTPEPPSPAAPGEARPAGPGPGGGVFDGLWPEKGVPVQPLTVLAALGIGAWAAMTWPERNVGLAVCLTMLAAGLLMWVVARYRRNPWTIGSAVLAALLATTTMIRDATSKVSKLWPILRTVGFSLVALALFGGLFASGDALFGSWAEALVPDLGWDTIVARTFVLVLVAGVALTGAYLALNPPPVDGVTLPQSRRVAHRWEWGVPVGIVVALFVGFLVAQATAMWGGHDYLERTTGLTYAEYVHQGFGQLTVATFLTVVVVGLTTHVAARDTPRDRMLLRLLLGALCVLTLAVVASALYRMSLYQDAFGYTVLRVFVDGFELWLGLVVVFLLIAGVRLSAWWVPRAVLVSAAVFALGFAAMSPDAWVAGRNIDRFDAGSSLDTAYLSTLSADATPVIVDRLPAEMASCVTEGGVGTPFEHDDWLSWNLGRSRAQGATEQLAAEGVSTTSEQCSALVTDDYRG